MKALGTEKPVHLKEQFQCDWSIWDFVPFPLRSHMDPSLSLICYIFLLFQLHYIWNSTQGIPLSGPSGFSVICLLNFTFYPPFSVFWLETGTLSWVHFCWEWSHHSSRGTDESGMRFLPTSLSDLGRLSPSAKETGPSSLLSHPCRRSTTPRGHWECSDSWLLRGRCGENNLLAKDSPWTEKPTTCP